MRSTHLSSSTNHPDQETIAKSLVKLINLKGHAHYEEEVTQYQHAVQTAYLANNSGATDELIAAALLHDIGHLLVDGDFKDGSYNLQDHLHEDLAADYLANYFPPAVTDPIRLHVTAKRYLVSTRSNYFQSLSDASRQSYYLQGGHMNDSEIAEFEAEPHCLDALKLREWDDQAKDVSAEVPNVESYLGHLIAAMY
ncbi:MAG: HD domain-containing protein [Saprospiraceae bacterium]|nr:HD domain-containing protein [Saprospiraceae bacterium]